MIVNMFIKAFVNELLIGTLRVLIIGETQRYAGPPRQLPPFPLS